MWPGTATLSAMVSPVKMDECAKYREAIIAMAAHAEKLELCLEMMAACLEEREDG